MYKLFRLIFVGWACCRQYCYCRCNAVCWKVKSLLFFQFVLFANSSFEKGPLTFVLARTKYYFCLRHCFVASIIFFRITHKGHEHTELWVTASQLCKRDFLRSTWMQHSRRTNSFILLHSMDYNYYITIYGLLSSTLPDVLTIFTIKDTAYSTKCLYLIEFTA